MNDVRRDEETMEETLSLDTSPERAAALAHQCTTRHLARRRGRFCSAHAVCRAAWHLGLPARSDGFFIPCRVPIRVPYGTGHRELILPADHLSNTDPQRSGPAIVRQSCGSTSGPAIVRPSSSAHGATHGRYLGAKGKHRKLYREDSPYSTDRRRRICAHGANDRPHNSTCTIHAG